MVSPLLKPSTTISYSLLSVNQAVRVQISIYYPLICQFLICVHILHLLLWMNCLKIYLRPILCWSPYGYSRISSWIIYPISLVFHFFTESFSSAYQYAITILILKIKPVFDSTSTSSCFIFLSLPLEQSSLKIFMLVSILYLYSSINRMSIME